MGKKRKNNPRSTVLIPEVLANEITREETNAIQNGLEGVLFGGQNIFGPGFGEQLSQVDTLFKNNRWYLISNMRQLLSEIYVEHGLIQTIVDVPVDDGMRGGVNIKSKQLSEEEVQKLEMLMDREDILNSAVGQALKWNRLYGGAAIVIITDQDPEEPFDLDAIVEDTPLEFRAVDMWELFWDKQADEGYNPAIQEEEFSHYSYYGVKLHKTRVMRLKGLTAPSFIRPRLRGWGFSVIESLVRSINQYLKNNDLTFEVLDEFKLDIFKIKNLTNSLVTPAGEQAIKKRVALASAEKNYKNSMVMDSEDDYVQKQLSFSGLAEIMKEIRMQIASDMRMPLTKIFGISATGFNSGQDDIENYNAMVESQIRAKSKYDILRILEIMCKKHFGNVPEDLSVEFNPLRVLSAEQEENVKTQKFNRVLQALQASAISPQHFAEACNKDNLLSIQLDTTDDTVLDPEDTAGEEDGEEGANAPNGQQSKVEPKNPKDAKDAKEAK